MTIYEEIQQERRTQDEKWGGPDHDDLHSTHDWIVYIVRHAGREPPHPWRPAFRRNMIRVAALAVAAVEWADRLVARDAKWVARPDERVRG